MANDLYDRILRDLITAKNTGDNYKTAKDALWKIVCEDRERYLEMFFHNWFNVNWAREIKPYKPRRKPTATQVKERRKADANLRGIALMNMFLSDGETRLKDATGQQVRNETGWLQLVCKHVKPHEIVGRKLTAQQLFNLKEQATPKDKAA
jgi:hypothetical protein